MQRCYCSLIYCERKNFFFVSLCRSTRIEWLSRTNNGNVECSNSLTSHYGTVGRHWWLQVGFSQWVRGEVQWKTDVWRGVEGLLGVRTPSVFSPRYETQLAQLIRDSSQLSLVQSGISRAIQPHSVFFASLMQLIESGNQWYQPALICSSRGNLISDASISRSALTTSRQAMKRMMNIQVTSWLYQWDDTKQFCKGNRLINMQQPNCSPLTVPYRINPHIP